MKRPSTSLLAGVLVGAGLLLTGCAGAASAEAGGDGDPAHVVRRAGAAPEIVFTADAARRIGLRTATVASAPGSSGGSVVPLAAVLYDKDGRTWTYAVVKPLTFVRERLDIARIDGSTVTLRSGPAVGTEVVTTGEAELLGVEYGVPGE